MPARATAQDRSSSITALDGAVSIALLAGGTVVAEIIPLLPQSRGIVPAGIDRIMAISMSKQVEVGQHYQNAGKAVIVWEVAKIVTQVGILHARLISIDGNRDTRLVACSVLLDTGRYRIVRDAVAATPARQ